MGWKEKNMSGRAKGKLQTSKDTACRILDLGKIEIMAGPETGTLFSFTGIKIYFNPYARPGRMMNCVLVRSGGIALLVLYFKLRFKNLHL